MERAAFKYCVRHVQEVADVAYAKKKAPAKNKANPRVQLKKKTAVSKSSKKATPVKAKPKNPAAQKTATKKAIVKKALTKKAPAKKAAAKPKAKVVAKKVASKIAPKGAAKAKPVVGKVITPPKPVPAKVPVTKAVPPKASVKIPETTAVRQAIAPKSATAPAKTTKTTKKENSVKGVSAKEPAPSNKVSGTQTPERQIARASVAVAKRPAQDTPVPAARPRVINLDELKLPASYVPSKTEEYMSPMQLLYFRTKLRNWRDELITESQETLDHLRTEIRDVGDEAERASRESDNILELRTRDRYRRLLKKIDEAIKRIEDGSYGFCEETGEDIGLARLEARPIATLTVDAQERRELFQKQFRDDR